MGDVNRGETKTNYRGYRARMGARLGGAAAIGGAVLTGMLMLLAPAASAALTSGTNVAPYTNTHLSPSKSVSIYGCASATGKKGVFAPLTGLGKVKTSGVAKTCSFTGFTYSSGSGGSGIVVAFDASVPSTATYTVDVNWTATYVLAEALSVSTCPTATVVGTSYTYSSCYASAYAEWFAEAYMVDMTNGTFYGYGFDYAYNSSYNDTYSYAYSGSAYGPYYYSYGANGGSSGTHTADLSFTPYYMLDSTHSYDVFFTIGAYSSAYLSYGNNQGNTWTAAASGSVNIASLGNGWSVNWISIT